MVGDHRPRKAIDSCAPPGARPRPTSSLPSGQTDLGSPESRHESLRRARYLALPPKQRRCGRLPHLAGLPTPSRRGCRTSVRRRRCAARRRRHCALRRTLTIEQQPHARTTDPMIWFLDPWPGEVEALRARLLLRRPRRCCSTWPTATVDCPFAALPRARPRRARPHRLGARDHDAGARRASTAISPRSCAQDAAVAPTAVAARELTSISRSAAPSTGDRPVRSCNGVPARNGDRAAGDIA